MLAKTKYFIDSVLLLFLLAMTLGCASGPQLDAYPRREIDRPYTLPNGVATWHIPTAFGHVRDNTSSKTLSPIPDPLLWESSISDTWNFVWSPFPLGFTHQISNEGRIRNGLSVLTSLSYSDSAGFRAQPDLAYSFRYKFSSDLALEVKPSFRPDIPFRSGEHFLWFGGVAAGPLFQITETFALKPVISLDVVHGQSNISSVNQEDANVVVKTTTFVGVGFSNVWSVSRQWDIRSSYEYGGIGAGNGYRAHIAVIDLVYFW